jgi:aspartate/methionine/tyrosine aminotransferase
MKKIRKINSEYMQWAKENAHITHNLATSGLMSYPHSLSDNSAKSVESCGDDDYGYEPLIDAIAARYSISPEMVFTTFGSSMANYISMALLLEAGDEVVIEQPTYELLLSSAEHLGADLRRFPRRPDHEYKIDPADVRSVVTDKTKLIILTNLHNPTCALIDQDTLKEIGTIAQSVGAYVLIDEVYLDSVFPNPTSSIHLSDRFIVTSSLTKVYGLSGLRCGWVLAQRDIVRQLWKLSDLMYVKHTFPAEQLSVNAFKQLNEIASWTMSILEQNRAQLTDFLKKREEFETYIPHFGIMIFPRFKPMSVEMLNTMLIRKYDTIVAPGRYFEMPDHLRIGYGLEPGIFHEGLRRLGEALDHLKK